MKKKKKKEWNIGEKMSRKGDWLRGGGGEKSGGAKLFSLHFSIFSLFHLLTIFYLPNQTDPYSIFSALALGGIFFQNNLKYQRI